MRRSRRLPSRPPTIRWTTTARACNWALTRLPSGVLLGSPATATVALVQDADVSTWYVWFGESSYTVTEGGTATIGVHLNSPWKPELNEALTVPLFDPEHQGGATADDYSGLPESVTFQPGQTRASFTVRVTEDSEDDDGESVLIGFRRLFPEDLEVGRYGPHKTTLRIADNDGETAVTVSFDGRELHGGGRRRDGDGAGAA